jgi:hypothetical protein
MALLDCIELDLGTDHDKITVYIDVADNSLARKWLAALNTVLEQGLHLEKNYCWLGWAEGERNGAMLIDAINASITAINAADTGYHINDHFTLNTALNGDRTIRHARFNRLHRYFEDLQGTAHKPSAYYLAADPGLRWHIRQLNLLCHEFESWALSWRKLHTAPEWARPSQLMCWLNAPRYTLDTEDLELFGIETINRTMGGVYVGVNKAVGKHHWEVFLDEGRDSRIGELVTSSLAPQTLACADFDIEWARDPGAYPWQQQHLADFRTWLERNGFDPEDKTLTIGHPQVAQVDLQRSFGTEDYREIWHQLNSRLNVSAVRTSQAAAEYEYRWSDADYQEKQIVCLG